MFKRFSDVNFLKDEQRLNVLTNSKMHTVDSCDTQNKLERKIVRIWLKKLFLSQYVALKKEIIDPDEEKKH